MNNGIPIACIIALIFASLGISFELSITNGELDRIPAVGMPGPSEPICHLLIDCKDQELDKENIRNDKNILGDSIFSNDDISAVQNNNAGTDDTALTLTESDVSDARVEQQETKTYKSNDDGSRWRDTSNIVNNNAGTDDTALD